MVPTGRRQGRVARFVDAKIISLIDAETHELEARITVRVDETMQYLADELSRLRDRVAKLEDARGLSIPSRKN